MLDYKALVVGIIGASIVFAIKENRVVKTFFKAAFYRERNKELSDELDNLKRDNNLTNAEAREKLFTNEIIKALEIDSPFWQVNRFLTISQGDRISFIDEKVGFVQGDFLGIIKSKLVGYDDLYVIRNISTSTLRKASVSYVKEDTINVYK